MEGLDFEAMLKDPEFVKFASKHIKSHIESKPRSPSEVAASGSTIETKPHIDHNDDQDEDRGRSRTRDTRIPSAYAQGRTLSGSPSNKSETAYISTERDKEGHRNQINSGDSSRHLRRKSASRDSNSQYQRRRSRSRSPCYRKYDYSRRQYSRSHSRSPCRYKDEHNQHYRWSRSQSPRQDRYNRNNHLDGGRHSHSSRHYKSKYGHRSRSQSYSCSPRRHKSDFRHRSRSQSPCRVQTTPRRNETKPLGYSGMLPSRPDDWTNPDYYYTAWTSYKEGGKHGTLANKTRGVRVKAQDKKTGDEVKYSTLLETMALEEKYLFIKEHGHPFAAVVNLPYFNPYGIVPLNDTLTAIIPKTTGKLYISSGQRLDYSEYVEGRGVLNQNRQGSGALGSAI